MKTTRTFWITAIILAVLGLISLNKHSAGCFLMSFDDEEDDVQVPR